QSQPQRSQPPPQDKKRKRDPPSQEESPLETRESNDTVAEPPRKKKKPRKKKSEGGRPSQIQDSKPLDPIHTTMKMVGSSEPMKKDLTSPPSQRKKSTGPTLAV